MTNLLLILGRLFLILFGYIAASLAASAFLNLLLIGTLDLPASVLPEAIRGSSIVAVPFVAMFVA